MQATFVRFFAREEVQENSATEELESLWHFFRGICEERKSDLLSPSLLVLSWPSKRGV